MKVQSLPCGSGNNSVK